MTITDPERAGIARALDQVERNAEALLRSVADARQALAETAGASTLGDFDRSVAEGLAVLDDTGTMAEAARSVHPAGSDLPTAERDLTPEPLRCADGFAAGGWVRVPEHPLLWVPVKTVGYCWCGEIDGDPDTQADEPHVAVEVLDRGERVTLHLRKYDQLPYLTEAEFDADCVREQAAGREAQLALVEEKALRQERAYDFGYGPEAA